MCNVYGYARISRKQQNIERQIRNIKESYPKAIIFQEAYTGTKMLGRDVFDKLLKGVKQGDTIVFDSVSRMSRNAESGIELYFNLYNRGVNLVFLKERHIDTDSYKKAMEISLETSICGDDPSGKLVKAIIDALTDFMKAKASDDIVKAFEQAQKEVDDLHQRTKEGIETARIEGKQIGQRPGAKLTTKKSVTAKEQMKKRCRMFGGDLKDEDAIKIIGISKPTFYKYKKELMLEMMQQEEE